MKNEIYALAILKLHGQPVYGNSVELSPSQVSWSKLRTTEQVSSSTHLFTLVHSFIHNNHVL